MTNKKLFLAIQKGLLITGFATSMVMANDVSNTIKTITQQDIINSGLNNLGDIINELVIANGEVLNQFKNYGGDGSTTVNFRGLGSNRVLVLLNGKRQATNVQGAFDFSSIPLSIIEKVEISQSNDTDSISGTINIITRDDFTGIETNAYYGQSSRNDAETQNYNISLGKKSEKASVFFNAEFSKNAPIYAGDRDISALPIYGTGLNNASTATPQGRFAFFDQDNNFVNVTTNPGSNGFTSPNDPDLIPFTIDNRFNYAPVNFLLTPQDKQSIYVSGKYEINDNISAHSSILYTRKESMQQMAPTPLFVGLWGNTIPTGEFDDDTSIGVGANNPYNPFGYELLPTYAESGLLLLGRRMVEMGNRTTQNKVDSYNIDIGLTGTIVAESNWDWNINYSQSKNDRTDNLDNLVNLYKVDYALSNECVGDVSCVPLNLFGGEGSITPEMIAYIGKNLVNNFTNQTDIFKSQLSSEIYTLPSGNIKFSAEVEHQNIQGSQKYNIRNVEQAGSYSDGRNAVGSYKSNSLSLGLSIPFLKKENDNLLDLKINTRYDNYSFAGSTLSGGFQLLYSPINSVSIDLSLSRVNRVPTIYELFVDDLPNRTIYTLDPCERVENSNLPGCPEGILQNFNNDTIISYYAGGGNDQLDVERWDKFLLSINYRPESIENLNVNINLYKNKSNNKIGLVDGLDVLNSCAYTGTLLCNRITRMEQYPYWVYKIQAGYDNYGSLENSGIEFSSNYSIDTNIASFNFKWDNLYTISSNYQKPNYEEDSIVEYDYLDITSYRFLDSEIPQFSSNLSVTMQKNDWRINYQLRYIAGYNEKCGYVYSDGEIVPNADPDAVGGVVPADFRWCNTQITSQRKVGGSAFQDMNFTYDFPEFKASVMLGVENIFDKTPPLSSSAFANSYNSSLYNGTGRYFWVRFSKQF